MSQLTTVFIGINGCYMHLGHRMALCMQQRRQSPSVPKLGWGKKLSNMYGCNLKNDRMISIHFQGEPFNITVIQVYTPTSNAEEDEVEWFYEDLQDLLEHPKKISIMGIFYYGDWIAKKEVKKYLE